MIAALFARLAPYKLMFEILVIGGLAAGAMVAVREFLEHERDIGRNEVKARWDKRTAADKLAAAAQAVDWTARLTVSTTDGTKREDTIRSLAASAAAATGGMRDTIAKSTGECPTIPSMSYVRLPAPTGSFLQSPKDDAQMWQTKLSDSTAKSAP